MLFTYNLTKASQQYTQKVVIVNSSPSCQFATWENFDSCANKSANGTEIVSESLVKILYAANPTATVSPHFLLQDGKSVRTFQFILTCLSMYL